MAIFPNPTAAVILFLLPFTAVSLPSDLIISELAVLQSQSPTGLIRLTDSLLRGILSLPTPRPFHFLVFFDAQKLHSKPDLFLPALKSDFSLVSSSFRSNNPDKKYLLFFFDIEFEESQGSFILFKINTLPFICLVPPSASDLASDSIPLNTSGFSQLPESIAELILSNTKLSVGQINHPPLFSQKQIVFIITLILIWAKFFIKRLISGNTILHDGRTWMCGAIFVYFCSVSGVMFNIIRKMPLYLMDRKNPSKIVIFYPGTGVQTGAEGFAIGFLYTIVGVLLAFVAHVLASLRNVGVQRFAMIVVMFVSLFAVNQVIFLDNWKTGYHIRGYWPSSWL